MKKLLDVMLVSVVDYGKEERKTERGE